MRDIIGDGGIRAIAGMVIAYVLTNFIYLTLMVSVFTLMIEKFDPQLFNVPIYSGYWVIFRRQTIVIVVVTTLLLFIVLAWLFDKYLINPVNFLAIMLFIVLFVNIYSSLKYRLSGNMEEITSGSYFDGYRELLEKSGMSHKKLWVRESPDGTAEIKTIGFLPHLNEIVLTKPLMDGLDTDEVKALIARELYLIKRWNNLLKFSGLIVNLLIIWFTAVIRYPVIIALVITSACTLILSHSLNKQERDADTFAAEMTSADDLVSALKEIELINSRARGELVEKSFFAMTGRRSPMDVRCDDILKRCGNNIETQDSKDVNITE